MGRGDLVTFDQLETLLPDVVAAALSQVQARPSSSGGIAVATGTVDSVGAGTVEVQFDEDEPGVLATVQGAAVVGQRVKVFVTPNGGAFIPGSTTTPGTPGGSSSTFERTLADAFIPGVVHATPAGAPTAIVSTGAISSFRMLAESGPPAGQVCTMDAYLNGVSFWADPADRPTLTAGQTNEAFDLASGVAVVDGDVITFAVPIPAGRGLHLEAIGT